MINRFRKIKRLNIAPTIKSQRYNPNTKEIIPQFKEKGYIEMNKRIEQTMKELDDMPLIENRNYLHVLKEIDSRHENKAMAMIYAFNYGMTRGRECEKDFNNWNSLCIFSYMHTYFREKGELPRTFAILEEWVEQHKKAMKEWEEHQEVMKDE